MGGLLTVGCGVCHAQVPVARTGFPSETLQALRFLLAPDAEVASAGGVQVRQRHSATVTRAPTSERRRVTIHASLHDALTP